MNDPSLPSSRLPPAVAKIFARRNRVEPLLSKRPSKITSLLPLLGNAPKLPDRLDVDAVRAKDRRGRNFTPKEALRDYRFELVPPMPANSSHGKGPGAYLVPIPSPFTKHIPSQLAMVPPARELVGAVYSAPVMPAWLLATPKRRSHGRTSPATKSARESLATIAECDKRALNTAIRMHLYRLAASKKVVEASTKIAKRDKQDASAAKVIVPPKEPRAREVTRSRLIKRPMAQERREVEHQNLAKDVVSNLVKHAMGRWMVDSILDEIGTEDFEVIEVQGQLMTSS